MTDFDFSDFDKIQPEEDAWHEYKVARDTIDAHRFWAAHALEAIEDPRESARALAAIEKAFAEQCKPLAARYNHIRKQNGLEPINL